MIKFITEVWSVVIGIPFFVVGAVKIFYGKLIEVVIQLLILIVLNGQDISKI